jgi:hypothetical protein
MENNTPSADTSQNNTESIFSGEEFSLQGYDKHIRQARNAIFTAAIILLINLVVLGFTVSDDYQYFWIDMIIWGLFILGFVGLGLWTKKKPYYAIIGALILYSAFIILNAVLDISTLWKGIILKIVIIVLLVKGLSDAKNAQEMKEQIGQ